MTELRSTQDDWDEFLKDIDNKVNKDPDTTNVINVGDVGPINLDLVDVRSAKPLTFKTCHPNKNLLLVLLRHFA